jgi:hypothetical protein
MSQHPELIESVPDSSSCECSAPPMCLYVQRTDGWCRLSPAASGRLVQDHIADHGSQWAIEARLPACDTFTTRRAQTESRIGSATSCILSLGHHHDRTSMDRHANTELIDKDVPLSTATANPLSNGVKLTLRPTRRSHPRPNSMPRPTSLSLTKAFDAEIVPRPAPPVRKKPALSDGYTRQRASQVPPLMVTPSTLVYQPVPHTEEHPCTALRG